jgi:hypothetical protein
VLVELFPSIPHLFIALSPDLQVYHHSTHHFLLSSLSLFTDSSFSYQLVIAFLNSFGQGIPNYVYIEVIAMLGPHRVVHTLELCLCFCD